MARLSVQLLPLEGELTCPFDNETARFFRYFTDDQGGLNYQHDMGADQIHDRSRRELVWNAAAGPPHPVRLSHARPNRLSSTHNLWRQMLALPGVGPYAASCLMLYGGRPERVNSDSVARALPARELGRPVSDKDVHAFFAPYGQWQGLVYNFYPWTSPTP